MALIVNNAKHNVPNTPQFTAAIMQKSRPSLLLTAPFPDPSELNSDQTQYQQQYEQDTDNNDIITSSLGLSTSSSYQFLSMDFPQSTLHYDLSSSLSLIINDNNKDSSLTEENLTLPDPFLQCSSFLSTDSEISTPYYSYVPETPSSLATTTTAIASPHYILNDTNADNFTLMTTSHETPSSINNNYTPIISSSSSVQRRKNKPCPSRNKHCCQWPDCIWSFKRAEHLKRHMLTHTGERKYRCDYPGCNKRFGRSDNFAAHRRIHQRNNPQFVPMSLQFCQNGEKVEANPTATEFTDTITTSNCKGSISQQLQTNIYHDNNLIKTSRQSSAKLDNPPNIKSQPDSSKKMRSTKRSNKRMNPITRRPSKNNNKPSSSSVDYFTIRPSSSQSHSQIWCSEQQKSSSNNYIVPKTNSKHQHFQLCIPGGGIKNYPSPAAETLKSPANLDNIQQKI
ncbi:14024_t:CDS:2 [Ambispora leptoticha]|uniref:14024_t:CDS:1 n=1 Tax=Ambispora leptoticha TaxID=144679 RepID=A0A9N9GCD1_9GLOM|nr:14024_t:CDS:2 [Ambispora leptoticha]